MGGLPRSLVWPLFFHHTKEEAERWVRRLNKLGNGQSEYERSEVISFWTDIMSEHALFTAHLLDPEEEELIEKAMKMSRTFSHLDKGTTANIASAIIREPTTTVGALIQNPESDPILSAAETILDFDTKSAQDVAAARIKSIIDPRLADHDRRETVKFVDELKRAV